jgi:hypothetical protein
MDQSTRLKKGRIPDIILDTLRFHSRFDDSDFDNIINVQVLWGLLLPDRRARRQKLLTIRTTFA